MKSTGIVRRIDELGRIVIPKEIRKKLKIKTGENLEINVYDGNIILTKYSPIESLSNTACIYTEVFNKMLNHHVIITDREKIIAISGDLKRKYYGKNISTFLEKSMDKNEFFTSREKKKINIIDNEEENGYLSFCTILDNGDAIGSVILLSFDKPISDQEHKITKVIANLLSKHFID